MASSDVLGYPLKKHFYRIHLENAWIAAFGALDLGDFETFLKESADRTYPDALAQIKKMGGGASEASRIRESEELTEKGGIEQYKNIAEGLRREGKEYEASAIDALIADLITAQSKPRRKAPERKPKPVIQQLPFMAPEKAPTPSGTHGTEYERLYNFIITGGMDELFEADRELKEIIVYDVGKKELTDTDRTHLSKLVDTERKRALEQYPDPGKELFKKPEKKPHKIRTATEILAEREIKEGEEGFEKRGEFKNIAELAVGLKPQYNKIVKTGLRDFQEETTKYMPKLNSHQLAVLAQEILTAYREKPATRIVDWLALGLMDKIGHEILAGGYDWAMSRNEKALDELVSRARTKNPDLPTDDKIKRDVRTALFALM